MLGDVRWFDRLAGVYDRLAPTVDATALDRGVSVAHRPVRRVLDVGGGPGRAVAGLPAPTKVVVDPARGMLRRARARGLGGVQADAARLPIRDGSVDAVVVHDALHHIGDRRGALEAAARTLRPGGVVVVRDFDPRTRRGRLLAAAEHLVGFESRFIDPDALKTAFIELGLDPIVLERGFVYTVVGRAPRH